ncbi:MAG TPA: M56 family metallopeptidase [Terriglobia bacterium]|nr:M56 family metallopeptidase [Terriglobia bacterium]
MSAWLAGMNQWAAAGLAALLNTLWYAAAVVALGWIVLRYSRRVNAATRYWIWTAVLGFILVLPFLPGLVARAHAALKAQPATSMVVAPMAAVPAAQGTEQLPPVILTFNSAPESNPWPLWLMAVWIAAAVWQLGRLLMGALSVRRLKARAEDVPIAKLPLALRRRVRVLASGKVSSPAAVGYLRPAVVVPPGLLDRLEEAERQDVLLHELAHLARYDDWLNLATRAIGALLVLHPLAPFVLGRIEREREMACDDFVVAHTGSAGNYARSLARLHDLHSGKGTRLLAPALVGRKVSLADRIESLLGRGREFSPRPSLAKLALSAFLLVLLLGAGGLIPGWVAIAQGNSPPPSFAVASIEPAHRENSAFHLGPDTVTFRNLPAEFLIQIAYGHDLDRFGFTLLPMEQIMGGPAWVGPVRLRSGKYTYEGYDIAARVAGPLAAKFGKDCGSAFLFGDCRYREQIILMLQSLLAERFKLKVKRETKQAPVYALAFANGGPKFLHAAFPLAGSGPGTQKPLLRPLHPLPCPAGMVCFQRYTSMGRLAYWLSGQRQVGRPVIDQTGLKGGYYIHLQFPRGKQSNSGLSIFTTLQQQLGLQLKPTTGPVESIVIEHIERPTTN